MLVSERVNARQFAEEGYLVVESLLDVRQDLEPLVEEYSAILDNLARRWYEEGKLTSTYADLPFGQRLIRVAEESGQPYYQYFEISLPQQAVTLDTPIHCGPAIFNLLRSPRLLDAVEALIGSEIYCNPIQHVRLKLPEHRLAASQRNGGTAVVDWHQDQGVVLPEADESEILTVWLPIFDATEENGTLVVVPRSHRGELAPHCPPGDPARAGTTAGLRIPERYIPLDRARPVPVKRGGVLFMHRRTMHRSLPNRSADIRWSFDLRYNPVGQPTGRPMFPGFVARSRQNPASELQDWRVWRDRWHEARARLAGHTGVKYGRWNADSPMCA